MMGTSTSFMMRSRPRRKGSICPVRVICPSAKMQTISSLRSASLAVLERVQHLARMLFAGNRNGLHHFGERLDDGVVVDALVHEEADGAVSRGDEQRDIDKRHVVADQQRAGFFREIVAADHVHAIDGARDEEENQAAEPLRQQIENIDGAERGDARRRRR